MLRPQLQHKQYETLEVLRTAVDDLIQYIPRKPGPLIFSLYLLWVSECLPRLLTLLRDGVTNRLRLLGLYWLVNGKELRHACQDVHSFADQIIDPLRLYPPISVNTRTAIRTTVLPTGGGLDRSSPVPIQKGSAVAFSVYSKHRRPDMFGMDAELFRPERWDEDLPMHQDPIKSKWGYLPFHGGPRICLGMDFALTVAGFTVVRLLQSFRFITLLTNERVELVGIEEQDMTLVYQSRRDAMLTFTDMVLQGQAR
ncbi:cytochrome P450 [Paraphoma chrysanthemicola]|nr:cytochrome P450 [Paraphoma chrysanthemicola]